MKQQPQTRQREPQLVTSRWNGRAFASASEIRRPHARTPYGSSRLTRSEARQLHRFAAKQAQQFNDVPRLVKPAPLQAISLQEFLQTPAETVVTVDHVSLDPRQSSTFDKVAQIAEALR